MVVISEIAPVAVSVIREESSHATARVGSILPAVRKTLAATARLVLLGMGFATATATLQNVTLTAATVMSQPIALSAAQAPCSETAPAMTHATSYPAATTTATALAPKSAPTSAPAGPQMATATSAVIPTRAHGMEATAVPRPASMAPTRAGVRREPTFLAKTPMPANQRVRVRAAAACAASTALQTV